MQDLLIKGAIVLGSAIIGGIAAKMHGKSKENGLDLLYKEEVDAPPTYRVRKQKKRTVQVQTDGENTTVRSEVKYSAMSDVDLQLIQQAVLNMTSDLSKLKEEALKEEVEKLAKQVETAEKAAEEAAETAAKAAKKAAEKAEKAAEKKEAKEAQKKK